MQARPLLLLISKSKRNMLIVCSRILDLRQDLKTTHKWVFLDLETQGEQLENVFKETMAWDGFLLIPKI